MLIREFNEVEIIKSNTGFISVLIVANGNSFAGVQSELQECGFSCSVIFSETDDVIERIYEQSSDIVLVDGEKLPWISRRIREEKPLPVIALVSRHTTLDAINDNSINDFILEPYNISELEIRIKRLLLTTVTDSSELITVGDLKIDQAKCEVSIGNKLVSLTFKEYELLKFLVTNKGRVFTRETLLDRVWGFDYFGGDRTVDVHIRRLRGKVEDAEHSFIETVRSIGYRFKEEI